MSYEVSLFARGVTREQVGVCLRDNMGVRGVYDDGTSADVFGVNLTLIQENNLDDESGIEFSRYPVQLLIKRYSGRIEPQSGDEMCRLLARVVARTLHLQHERMEYIVVEGVQRILERN